MKKKVLFTICLIAMAILGIISSGNYFNGLRVFDDNTEALTSCDITRTIEKGWGKNKQEITIALLICVGEEGECYTDTVLPIFGHVEATCSGRNVTPEIPDLD